MEGVELERKQNVFWNQWSSGNNLGTCTIGVSEIFENKNPPGATFILDDLVLMMMLVTVAMSTMMTMVVILPNSVRGGDELIHLPASHLAPTLTDEPSLWRRKSDNMPPSPLRNKYWRNYWLQRLRGQFVWSAQCSTHLRNIRPVLSFSY